MISVFIADDEDPIRRGLLSLPWQSIGAQAISSAGDGLDVIEVLQSEMVDVVLSDIRMPGLDGVGIARWVSERGLATRVVLLSGYGDFEYARQAIEFHVSSYLLKPSSPTEILAAVEAAGAEARATRAQDMRLKLLENELGKRQLVLDDAGLVLGNVAYSNVAEEVLAYVVENFDEPISLSTASDDLHFSTFYLSRVIRKATGYTFVAVVNALRVHEAARMLRDTDLPFAAICDLIGAQDSRYFGQVFKRHFGTTPSSYRRSPVMPSDEKLALVVAVIRERAGT